MRQTQQQTQDPAWLMRAFAETLSRFTTLVTRIARRVAATRDERVLPWYDDPSASRGL